MSVLKENLKHLYQNRSFLWTMLIVTVIAGLFDLAIMKAGNLNEVSWHLPAIGWVIMFAFSFASLRVDLMTKEFVYCLPEKKSLSWRLLVIAGAISAAVWSIKSMAILVAFGYVKAVSIFSLPVIMILASQISYYMILFWLNAWFGTKVNYGLGIMLLIFELMLINKVKIDPYTMTVGQQFIVVLIGVVVTYLSWSYWCRRELFRKYFGDVWFSSFGDMSQRKMGKAQHANAVKLNERKGSRYKSNQKIEEFFINRIRQAKPNSRWEIIWGSIYRIFGSIIIEKNALLVIMSVTILLMCAACYLPDGGGNMFIMPLFMMGLPQMVDKCPFVSTLTLGSRKEIYWSNMAAFGFMLLLLSTVVISSMIICMVLKVILPEVAFMGKVYPLEMHLLFISLFVYPFVIELVAIMILLWRYKQWLSIIYTVGFPVLLITLIVSAKPKGIEMAMFGFGYLIVNTCLFFMALKVHTSKCDLVKQTK